LMALGAAWLVAVEAPTTGNALLALALAGAALAGRLSRPSACVLTAGPGPTGGEATTASPACGDHPGTARATRTAVSGIREDGRHGTDAGGRGG
uniref:hypothetical protein n=1 Tax=Intrasporangium sp. TaxID=1925024 RepID=UPI003221DA65